MNWHRSGKLTSILALLVLVFTSLPCALAQSPTTTTVDFNLVLRGWPFGYVTDYDNGFPLDGATVDIIAGTGTPQDLRLQEVAGGFIPMFVDWPVYPLNPSVVPDALLTAGLASAGYVPQPGASGGIPEGPWQERALPPFDPEFDGVYEDYGGRGYLVGGYGANGQVGIYDPDTDSWTLGASEPSPRIVYPVDACVGLNAGGEGVIILFNDTNSGATTLHRYNIATNSWDTPPVPAGFPANGLWATDIVSLLRFAGQNVCYISGGATIPGGGDVSSLYEYHPDTNTVVNQGNYTFRPAGFDFHASWYVPWIGGAGAVCVGGGVDSSSGVFPDTQCYDIAAGLFRAPNADLGAMLEGVWGMADGVLYEDGDYQLWIVYGVDAGFQMWRNSMYYSHNDSLWHMGPLPPAGFYRLEGTNIAAADGCSFYVAGCTGTFQHWLFNYRNYSAGCPPSVPTAAFTATTPVCEGVPVGFYFTGDPGTPPADQFTWWFGDGITSTLRNPTHLYAAPRAYTVTLEVCNLPGCDTIEGTVEVLAGPDAAFSFTADLLTVTFTNASQNAGSYEWRFGDGITSTLDNPIHAYAAAGTYTVTLIAYGCGEDAAAAAVTVGVLPEAGFLASTPVCLGEPTVFTNTSSDADSYLWAFGDGATSTETNPIHLYANAGGYDANLEACSEFGCDALTQTVEVLPLPAAAFSFTANLLTVTFTNASQNAGSYEWRFGDGITSALDNPTHTYAAAGTYTVTLAATGPCGTVDAAHVLVVTSCSEVSILSIAPQVNGCSVTLTATLLGDPPFVYEWAFGDGDTSALPEPSHTYTVTGTYSGRLDVWNCVAGHDTAGFTVTVDCGSTRYDFYLPLIVKTGSVPWGCPQQ